jgi:hypothetical protein
MKIYSDNPIIYHPPILFDKFEEKENKLINSLAKRFLKSFKQENKKDIFYITNNFCCMLNKKQLKYK